MIFIFLVVCQSHKNRAEYGGEFEIGPTPRPQIGKRFDAGQLALTRIYTSLP